MSTEGCLSASGSEPWSSGSTFQEASWTWGRGSKDKLRSLGHLLFAVSVSNDALQEVIVLLHFSLSNLLSDSPFNQEPSREENSGTNFNQEPSREENSQNGIPDLTKLSTEQSSIVFTNLASTYTSFNHYFQIRAVEK